MNNNLIERYVYSVTKQLPEKNRNDIGEEIKTLIDDMLQQYPDDEEQSKIEKVLLELGNPNDLAEQYRENKRYLIGPENFDYYVKTLKIVSLVIFIVLSVVSIIEFIYTQTNVISGFSIYIGNVIQSLVQGFAWVTFVFMVIEYKGVKLKEEINSDWRIKDLPLIPSEKSSISRGESVVGIVFITLFSMILYFIPETIAAYIQQSDGSYVTIQVFNMEALNDYGILIMSVFVLGILKEATKIMYGHWNLSLAIINSILSIISAAFVLIIFLDPAIWNPNFMTEITSYLDLEPELLKIKQYFKNGFIAIFIIANLIEIGTGLYKGLKSHLNFKKTQF